MYMTKNEVLCELIVTAKSRAAEIIGAAHALYYHWKTLDGAVCACEMTRIRKALNELTEAVEVAEAMFGLRESPKDAEILQFGEAKNPSVAAILRPLLSGHDEFVP
jgi:hypothetical protein